MTYVLVYAYVFMSLFMFGWLNCTADSWQVWKAIWWPVTLPYVLGKSTVLIFSRILR